MSGKTYFELMQEKAAILKRLEEIRIKKIEITAKHLKLKLIQGGKA